MKLLSSIGLMCLLSISSLNAQNSTGDFEKKFDIAEEQFSAVYQDGKSESIAYAKGGYAEVIPALQILEKYEPNNMNIAFKLGVCYRNSRMLRSQAIPYFEK